MESVEAAEKSPPLTKRERAATGPPVCRNIRVLHHFEPPTTPQEIRSAAEQYVRKVSGVRQPAKADVTEFERAVDAVAEATTRLLERLPSRGEPRTREQEQAKAKARWTARAARIEKASGK